MNQQEIEQRLDVIGKSAYSTFNTILNSYNSAIHCIQKPVEGAFVECGVGAGSQVGAMALANQVHNGSRKIWVFDSFEGIPMACEKDDQQPGIGYFKEPLAPVADKSTLLTSSGITAHSLENVKNNLSKWQLDMGQFTFVKGWFQNTLPEVIEQIDKIAILRLDGDLYESTRVCLKFLFPKLVKGGILIIDDWALAGCKLACDEYFGDYKQLSEKFEVEGTTPVYFYKK